MKSKTPSDSSKSWYAEQLRQSRLQLEDKWRALHLKAVLGTVLFSFFLECTLGALIASTELRHSSLPTYILKYIVAPGAVNFCLVTALILLVRSPRLSQSQKNYLISVVYVLICTVLYTVHSIFVLLMIIFVAPVMMTLFYTDLRLTTFTTLSSLAALTVSEFFLVWDPGKNEFLLENYRFVSYLIAVCLHIAIFFLNLTLMSYEKQTSESSLKIFRERQLLERQLSIDSLTGVYNRSKLPDELARLSARKPERPIVLAVADIDRFKEINDCRGHHFGDQCLVTFARALTDYGRGAVPFRFGGDEFCLLFGDTGLEEAKVVCESIRRALERGRVEGSADYSMTASFGLALYQKEDDSISLFTRADQALYRAKERRNCVRVFTPAGAESAGAAT